MPAMDRDKCSEHYVVHLQVVSQELPRVRGRVGRDERGEGRAILLLLTLLDLRQPQVEHACLVHNLVAA